MVRRWCRRLHAIAGATIVFLGGAGVGDGEPVSDGSAGVTDVRPFAEAQAGDFVFEAGPTDPDRGIFHVTTTSR